MKGGRWVEGGGSHTTLRCRGGGRGAKAAQVVGGSGKGVSVAGSWTVGFGQLVASKHSTSFCPNTTTCSRCSP